MAIARATDDPSVFAPDLAVHKMPAHWLMARLGKRVLRPGGLETTRWLLEHGAIGVGDDVVEFAPGLGVTAKQILARRPRSYTGIERDENAVSFAERALAATGFPESRIVRADAGSVPLPAESATVVVGEAMLSMQPAWKKRAIIAEAQRLVRAGGRYLIHELALRPDDIDAAVAARIEQDLSACIHVGVRIGTRGQWKQWIEEAGFEVEHVTTMPMRLLEPGRLVDDEGVAGAARFVFNALRTPGAAKRLFDVRRAFRRHRQHLCAVALVARRA